jgi:phosphoglycerate dehydrogenase-like enzyme
VGSASGSTGPLNRDEDLLTTVTVLDDYQGVALDVANWSALGAEVTVVPIREHIGDPAELARRLAGSDVVVLNRERTEVTAELLDGCPDLRLIITLGMRNAAVDVAAATERGIVVCGTRMLSHPTAELTWGLITSLARGIARSDGDTRAGVWQAGPLGLDLSGSILGVAGFGRLGGAVARIGVAFGMEVLVHSRSACQEEATEIGANLADKETLIARSDVLTLHLPLTAETRGFVGAAELRACKPGMLMVNTSRGPVVDTEALIAALKDGRVGGAALDVLDQEPIALDDPLLSAPNTILTPHLGYVTLGNYQTAFGDVVEDIAAWRAGSPVRVIDL